MKRLEVEVHRDYLRYQSYPIQYPPLRELQCIRPSDIELIFGEYRDFEILLRNGSVIFFPETKKIALQHFVRINQIQVVRGTDVWDLLTEPFLDRSFTEEESQRTIGRLADYGFDEKEVVSIRKKVDFLWGVNFFAMEWVTLGLANVLWGDRCPEDFARWAFRIAERGYRRAKPYDLGVEKTDRGREDWLQDRLWNALSREDTRIRRNFYKPEPIWKKLLPSELKGPAKFDHKAFHGNFTEQRRAHGNLHQWIMQEYAAPQRSYHNTKHLEQVVSLLYSFWPDVTGAALLAAWFHDVVYVPGANDNEERSAAAMEPRLVGIDLQPVTVVRARELVLYTKAHGATQNPDEQMMHDADMGIFGMENEAYAKYAAEIREEYQMFPDAMFRQGRAEFLQKLLETSERRGRFFYRLDPVFEENVKSNIASELAVLRDAR